MSRILRFACIAVLLVCQGTSARCPALPSSATLSNLTVVVKPHGDKVELTLSGVMATLDGVLDRDIGPQTICRAAIGSTTVANADVCGTPRENEFRAGDSITADGKSVSFSLGYEIASKSTSFIAAERDRAECPPVLYRISLGKDDTVFRVSPRPDAMSANDVTFDTRQDDLLQRWFVAFTPAETDEASSIPPRSTFGKESWNAYLLQQLGGGCAAIFLVLAALYIALPKTLAAKHNLDGSLLHPASRALSLVAGALFLTVTGTIGNTLFRTWLPLHITNLHHLVMREFPQTPGLEPAILIILPTVLSTLVAAVLAAVFAVLRSRGKYRPLLEVLTRGSLITLYAALICDATAIVEAVTPLGYEIPALLMSALISTVAISSLRNLFDLSRRAVPALILICTLTVFFPVGPVVHGIGSVPPATLNTQSWFQFLAPWVADVLFSIALLAAGFHLVKAGTEKSRIDVSRALLVLLFLSLSGIRSITPTEAIALAGLWVLADNMLFHRVLAATGTVAQNAAGTPVLDHIPFDAGALRAKALIGGTLAVVVFWFQYSLRPIPDLTFAALFAANVLLTAFTKGALAVMLLGSAFNVLRGGSAVAKAGLIAVIAVGASLVANVQSLLATRHALPILIGDIDLLTATLLVAVACYDIPNARKQVGNLPLSDLFKGTTLGHAVPIIAGAATAFFAAISPALYTFIGNALGDLLKQAVPTITNLPH